MRSAWRAYSSKQYRLNPDKRRLSQEHVIASNPDKKRAASKARYEANPGTKRASSRAYRQQNQESAIRRDRYALAEPKPDQVELYMKNV